MNCKHCNTEIKYNEIYLRWKSSKTGHIKHRCKECNKINNITQDIQGTLHTY